MNLLIKAMILGQDRATYACDFLHSLESLNLYY